MLYFKGFTLPICVGFARLSVLRFCPDLQACRYKLFCRHWHSVACPKGVFNMLNGEAGDGVFIEAVDEHGKNIEAAVCFHVA